VLLPAPRTGRDLLEAFRLYDPAQGIAKFLDRFDLSTVSPRQAVYCAFGRLPAAAGARTAADYNPRGHMRNILQGEEFQKRLLNFVLEAYPEKRRLLFVHVPKCAGSDLTSFLTKTNPAFNFRLVDRAWVTSDKMFSAIKVLADELAYADHIFVHGHVALRQYIADGLVRFDDEVFTIVRDPLDMVMSRINYMLARIASDPEQSRVDTRDWLRLLNPAAFRAVIETDDSREAAREMLFAHGLIPANPVCRFLGDGTAQTALDLCARADVEITHIDRYEEWLHVRWGVAGSTRANASRKMVSLDMLGEAERARAEALTSEDRIFVECVRRGMQEGNKCFVMGTRLKL
jgi:hypothetical protein